MAPDVATALARLGQRALWTSDDDLVFPGATGTFMDASAMYRRFVSAAARAGLGRLRFHDLRHTFGTTMAANPRVELRRLQEWMGHADMTTTQRYSHFTPRHDDVELVAEAFAAHEGSATPRQRSAGDRPARGRARSSSLASHPESRRRSHDPLTDAARVAAAISRRFSGRLNDSSRDRCAGCRELVTAQNVRIEINVHGPHDRSELTIHGDGRENVPLVPDLREDSAGLEHASQIDLVYGAISERQPEPALRERLDLGDGSTRCVHGSGAIGVGGSGI
jgi:hypothetical protein